MTRITGIRTHDLRFPTSDMLDGSDAMNPDPDYSAAYVILETDGAYEGHGLTFTLGRGTEICVAAIKSLSASQYAATTAAKRKGKAAGKQFVKQPKSIASKVKKYRSFA